MVLSVIITTFNQAEYIEETIHSVLRQETSFEYEIIIADDKSTDNTATIIEATIAKHNNILFIKNEINLGVAKNYAQCLRRASGRYIADLGGDDIWTDVNKLEKQVRFLEENPNCGMVHTQYGLLFDATGKVLSNYGKNAIAGGFVFEDIIVNNTICSITACYRKELIVSLIAEFQCGTFAFEDLAMWLEISQHSAICYIEDSTALYRVKQESVSRSKSYEKKEEYYRKVKAIREYFIQKYSISNESLRKYRQVDCVKLCCLYYLKEDYYNFKRYYYKIEIIPKRLRVMKLILSSKVTSKLLRPLKHILYKQI